MSDTFLKILARRLTFDFLMEIYTFITMLVLPISIVLLNDNV